MVKGANSTLPELRVPPLISNFKTAPCDNAIDLPYTDSIPKIKRCQQLFLLFFLRNLKLKKRSKMSGVTPLTPNYFIIYPYEIIEEINYFHLFSLFYIFCLRFLSKRFKIKSHFI